LGKTARGTGEALRGGREQVTEAMGEMLRSGEEAYYGPEEYTKRQLAPVEQPPSMEGMLAEAAETPAAAPEPEPKVPESTKGDERDRLYEQLRGMPEQVRAQHKAKMSEIEAERLLDILRFNRSIDPEVAKSIMDKVAFNMKISDKYSGMARGREKAVEEELRAGSALDRQISYIREREKATGERMIDVKQFDAAAKIQVKNAADRNKLMMFMHEAAVTDKLGSTRGGPLRR